MSKEGQTKSDIEKIIQKAVTGLFLLENDGTIFSSSLALSCLSEIEIADDTDNAIHPLKILKKKLADSIIGQKSSSWSLNYRCRGSIGANYPDDLDSTSCALIALEKARVLDVNPEILANFSKNLILAETQEGGPYRTWLTSSKKGVWGDVDPSVNANIAYFLGSHDIYLENLDSYLVDKADQLDFKSLYYHRKIVTIYFLSRYLALPCEFLKEKRKSAIKKIASIARSIANMAESNPFEKAIALSALTKIDPEFKTDSDEYKSILTTIISAQESHGLWPAYPTYIEEIKGGETKYYSSRLLSTAFCLEALILFEKAQNKSIVKDKKKSNSGEIQAVIEKINSSFRDLFSDNSHFKEDSEAMLKYLEKRGTYEFIALLPYHFSQSLVSKTTVEFETIINLGLANLLGWIGYTIQDNVMDESKDLYLIPFSNVCIRKSLELFEEVSPNQICKNYIRSIFNRIDAANNLEIINIRRKSSEQAPDDTLSDKSFGHALGPLVIFMRLNYEPNSRPFKTLEYFFKNYIKARQRNDDAHDWEEDLLRGYINSACRVIFESSSEKDQNISIANRDKLREVFWRKAINTVVAKVYDTIAKARMSALELREIVDPTFLESLLQPIKRSAQKAVTERDKALEFLESLNKTTVNKSNG